MANTAVHGIHSMEDTQRCIAWTLAGGGEIRVLHVFSHPSLFGRAGCFGEEGLFGVWI